MPGKGRRRRETAGRVPRPAHGPGGTPTTNTEEWPGREGRRGRRLQPFASFRYRNYRRLWAANATQGALYATHSFALTWVVLEALDRDYPDALFTVALALPALLLGLPAGLLADRRDRRRLLMASHLLTGLFLLATTVLAAADVLSLPLLVLMAILAAGGLALGEPVRFALIPAVVPKERILNANALDHFGVLLGAAVGAGLQSAMLRFWALRPRSSSWRSWSRWERSSCAGSSFPRASRNGRQMARRTRAAVPAPCRCGPTLARAFASSGGRGLSARFAC